MDFNLLELWSHMGIISKSIAVCLLIMGVLSIGVVIERAIKFSRSAKESRLFARRAAPALDELRIGDLVDIAKDYKNSALAKMFGEIVKRFVRGHEEEDGKLSPVELARSEAARRRDALSTELRRGMGILASVGSVAPFVGLLGTVMGIIAAFRGIGTTGSGGIAAVSIGISEALAETALGLMVAIPAVLFYNYLTHRVNDIETALERSASELLDEMENQHGRKSADKRLGQAAA